MIITLTPELGNFDFLQGADHTVELKAIGDEYCASVTAKEIEDKLGKKLECQEVSDDYEWNFLHGEFIVVKE